MIIELPILNGGPPNTGNSCTLVRSGERFAMQFAVNQGLIFSSILARNYLNGHSIDVKLFWSAAGVQTATWGAQFQRLDVGDLANVFTFSTQRTSTIITSGAGIATGIINLPVGGLDTIVGGDMFRLLIKLTGLTGAPAPLLMNVALLNGS